jgi:release factor glutamine methyltransferase
MATVREVLLAARKALAQAGCDSPDLESDCLLAHALGVSRGQLLAMRSATITTSQAHHFEQLLARRLDREPLAYIVGGTEFYGRWFGCAPGVLIPRVDTETLVDCALTEIDRWGSEGGLIIELGVGSGCVICSILAERTNVVGFGIDVSETALRITTENAAKHGVLQRLTLIRSDWFTAVPIEKLGTFRLVVSNPPYIDPAGAPDLQPEVRDHEPRGALFAEDSGYAAIASILAEAHEWLRPGGTLLLEIGHGQAPRAVAMAARFPYSDVRTFADTAGIARVLSARAHPLA